MYAASVGSSDGMTQSAKRFLRARLLELEAGTSDEASRQEMEDVKHALHRIEQGTWGRCEKCEGAIGRDRLRALPEARTCVDCAH
jgi:DnaK suppressor protein